MVILKGSIFNNILCLKLTLNHFWGVQNRMNPGDIILERSLNKSKLNILSELGSD